MSETVVDRMERVAKEAGEKIDALRAENKALATKVAELEAERDALEEMARASGEQAVRNRDLCVEARHERDAAVRARAEVEAMLEGVRSYAERTRDLALDKEVAAAQSGDERGMALNKHAMVVALGVLDALDAHPSDALRALLTEAVRAGAKLGVRECRARAEAMGQKLFHSPAVDDDDVAAEAARVLGGGR